MRRLNFLELHERAWYPTGLRQLFQDSLGLGLRLFRVYEPIEETLTHFAERTDAHTVLDLCSGSGETAKRVWKGIAARGGKVPKLVLSDLYPPESAVRSNTDLAPDTAMALPQYWPSTVDATAIPDGLPRVRSMFTCLHHFDEAQLTAILEHAARSGDGLAAFEMTERKLGPMLGAASTLLTSGPLTVIYLRPLRWQTLLWCLLIPILPLTMAIDSVLSQMRSYTVAELEAIVERADTPGFEWHIGQKTMPILPGSVTYLLGWRRGDERRANPEHSSNEDHNSPQEHSANTSAESSQATP